jgi:hypothetical protein
VYTISDQTGQRYVMTDVVDAADVTASSEMEATA